MTSKIQCECGALVFNSNLSRHKKSKKHEMNMYKVNQNKNDAPNIPEMKLDFEQRYVSRRQFKERFDQHKLHYMLQNKHKFDFINSEGKDTSIIAEKMLRKSKKGVLQTSYGYAKGATGGRLFAKGATSLQNLTKRVRHTVAKDYYDDFDFNNCHVRILLHLTDKANIENNYIKDYVQDREKHLQDLMNANDKLTRGKAKQYFLELINNGDPQVEFSSMFFQKFKKQSLKAINELCKLNPDLYERCKQTRPTNPIGSCVNMLYCEVENQCLSYMIEYLTRRGFVKDEGVLCFDGFMAVKNDKLDREILNQCESFILEKTGVEMPILLKPMDEEYKLPAYIPDYIEYQPFDIHDPFNWCSFESKYREYEFNSMNDIIDKVREDLARVFAYISGGAPKYIIKTNAQTNPLELVDGRSNFTNLKFIYLVDGKQKRLNFKDFISINGNKINSYSDVVFDPSNTDESVFNLYRGTQAIELDTLTPEDIKQIEPILYHMEHILCSGEKQSYDYLLSLLAWKIAKPGDVLGKIIFLYSQKHGTGKNCLWDDFVGPLVLGTSQYLYTTGIDQVIAKHNDNLVGKTLLVCDELALGSDRYHSAFDKLKSIATGPTLIINPKGLKKFTIKNYMTLVVNSNHLSVKVESQDRRWFIPTVSEAMAGNTNYFNRLYSCFTQKNANIFLTFLIQHHKNHNTFNKLPNPPLTKYKRELMYMSIPPQELFIQQLQSGEHDFRDMSEALTPMETISKLELWNHYKEWCKITNNQAYKQRTFTRVANTILKEKRTNSQRLHIINLPARDNRA